MIFVRFLRLLAGWVSFRVSGGFPERFINLCSRENIPLWNLKNEGGALSAATTIAGYRHLRSCAVRSGMRSRV
ncbi:MAG: sporulation protein YqfD, partial [Clostridia bacterium]|nr:sporulation protein YqfD [Clostridia bacterium]